MAESGFWRRRHGPVSDDAVFEAVDAGKMALFVAALTLGWRPLDLLDEIRRSHRPRRLGRWLRPGMRIYVVDPPWRPTRPPEPVVLTRIGDRALRRDMDRRRLAGQPAAFCRAQGAEPSG